VGKKPPQSQKGGSRGLTPRMSAGLTLKEGIFFYFFFFWSQATSQNPAGPPASRMKTKKLKLKIKIIYFLYFF
jgi:hypothetical protein